MMNTFLIDTNTLVYGYNKSVEFHAAALMIQNNIKTIITANDKHFINIKEIKVWNPFTKNK